MHEKLSLILSFVCHCGQTKQFLFYAGFIDFQGFFHNACWLSIYILSILHSSNRITERLILFIPGFFSQVNPLFLSFSEGSSSIDKRGEFNHAYTHM